MLFKEQASELTALIFKEIVSRDLIDFTTCFTFQTGLMLKTITEFISHLSNKYYTSTS